MVRAGARFITLAKLIVRTVRVPDRPKSPVSRSCIGCSSRFIYRGGSIFLHHLGAASRLHEPSTFFFFPTSFCNFSQPCRRVADVPVLGRRRLCQRLASRAPRS